MDKMDTQQLIRHIHRSDLTALEKRYLEGLVEARTPREGMRLIDADALKKRIGVIVNGMIEGDETETELKFFNMINYVLESSVDETPTIEAEPVRHSRWEWGEDGWQCGECKKPLEDTLIFYYDNCNGEPDVKHCPNCGAKMRKENENA